MLSKKQQGFTIVELLIVVVVIAILAAITIVAYNGISQKAREVALQADLNSSAKILANDKTISGETGYPATLDAANQGRGIKPSNGASYQYRVNNAVNPKTYCLTVTSGQMSYFINQNNNIQTGVCAGHGAGGVAPITNYDSGAGSRSVTTTASAAGGTRTSASGPMPFGSVDQRYFRIAYTTATSSKNLYLCNEGVEAQGAPVVGGQTYTFSAWVNPSWAGTQLQLRVRAYDNVGTLTASPASPSTNAVANQWQRLTYTYTVPGNAVTAATCIIFAAGTSTSPPASSKIDISGFMITDGSTVYPYADGDSPGWAWSDDGAATGPATSSGPPL